MVWWRSGEEGPCIKFVVQILPALAKAEHSEIHTLESQVQKEGSLKKKKKNFTLSLSKCFLCSWNSVGFFSAATERQGREQRRARALSSEDRICWCAC